MFQLNSPDGHLNTTITIGEQLTYDIKCNGKQVLAASPLSMTLENGTVWGGSSATDKQFPERGGPVD